MAETTEQKGLDPKTIDTILQTGLQVGGTIAAQRQASGKAAARRARIEACGRKPLFNRRKRADYDKCVAAASQEGAGQTRSTAPNVPLPPSGEGQGNNKTMMYVGIGLGVLVVGALGFYLFKKFKK